MEAINSLDTADIQSQPTVPLSPHVHVPPTLRGEECYHVFISYSSTDYQWTHSLINQLESRNLQVCYHERDFTPGRTVLENMSECIQESQKVLLVLSPEFVRSRWCLLEANMSLFRDCLERKPIIPVLLDPGVSVPLHLYSIDKNYNFTKQNTGHASLMLHLLISRWIKYILLMTSFFSLLLQARTLIYCR
uniref:TIR domain-containing protein n=1 Tax=Acanthochromis polyacanthus TaxID=80966 RepID=A0A3Q1FFE1_9TELE